MEFFQRESHKNNNKNKKRLSQDQVRLLERSFSSNKKLEPERKVQLAEELGIPLRQVAVWYQNKRARWRTQSLELDCGTLQLRLENALAEKRKLEREVDRLRGELQKAKKIMALQFAVDYKKPPPIISTAATTSNACKISSDWCEELGGSSRTASFCDNYYDNQDMNHIDDQIDLQLDDHELFACLMGSDDDGVNC